MTRVLYVSIVFTFFVGIAISLTTRRTRSRHPKINEFRTTLSKDKIARLQSLRIEMVEFLATYERPVFVTTIRTVKTTRENRKKWRTNSKRFPTTKFYETKRTYPRPFERMTMFYLHFLDLFSEDDEGKRKILTTLPYKNGKIGPCYLRIYEAFVKHCNYAYYALGGMGNIKALLARLCLADWVTLDKATYIFKNTCRSRFQFNTLRWSPDTTVKRKQNAKKSSNTCSDMLLRK